MGLIKNVVQRIQEITPLTIVSHGNIRNSSLRQFLLNNLQREPGDLDGFLADPFYEAMFPWTLVDESLDSMVLTGKIQPRTRQAIAKASPRITHLRTHQAEALEAIRSGQSIVVTTGTSSGKTECFLYPILDMMAKELADAETVRHGVRALFLYPLNALIESQKERFNGLCSNFGESKGGGKQARFAIFNGRTPNKSGRNNSSAQMVTREEIRARDEGRYPPQMLITNSTMLEYALVRPSDRQIFEKSRGNLRFVVLDEAHTYLGSDAAEMAMRLRRTLNAFGVKPESVQFIATSATVGGENVEQELQDFLANLGGLSKDKVRVIGGDRRPPVCLPLKGSSLQPTEALAQILEANPDRHFELLRSTPKALGLRTLFQQRGRLTQKEIGTFLGLTYPDILTFLDLASQARNPGQSSEFFLPLKAHLFQRAFPGIWACWNPDCSEKQHQPELKEDWKFGNVFLNHPETRKSSSNLIDRSWSKCECGSSIFQVVYCRHCGDPHLAGESNATNAADPMVVRLTGRSEADAISDQDQLEVEDENDPIAPELGNNPGAGLVPVLLHPCNGKTEEDPWSHYDPGWLQDNETESEGDSKLVRVASPSVKEIRCSKCRTLLHLPDQFSGGYFPTSPSTGLSGSHTPPKSIYQSLAGKVVREDAPANKTPERLPLQGKKLLGFTDSRQGTAYNAAAQGLHAELTATRIWLFRALVEKPTVADPIAAFRADLELEAIADDVDVKEYLNKPSVRKRILQAESDAVVQSGISFEDAKHMVASRLKMAVCRAHAVSSLEEILGPDQEPRNLREVIKEVFHLPVGANFDQLASLFLWRELVFRNRRKRCLESLGMLTVEYPAIEKILVGPTNIQLSDYKGFLRFLLDFAVRRKGAVQSPGWDEYAVRACFGESVRSNEFPEQDPTKPRYEALNPPSMLRDYERLVEKWLESIDRPTDWDTVKGLFERAILDLNSHGILVDGKLRLEAILLKLPNNLRVCPNTRTLLDRTLGDFSPFSISRADKTVLVVSASEEFPAPQSLAEWEAMKKASPDWWTDLHLQILSTSQEDAFTMVQEHSAQLEAHDLIEHQKAFEDGRINILNCSTTMEMGVDIGDVSMVAMTNVPPYSHNYIQRAGRAGRGEQGQSLAWVVAGVGSHDQRVWERPLDWVNNPQATPKISLESPIIAQRHINAWLLAQWLKDQQGDVFGSPRTFFLGIPGAKPRCALSNRQGSDGQLLPSSALWSLMHETKAVQPDLQMTALLEQCVEDSPVQSFLDWLKAPAARIQAETSSSNLPSGEIPPELIRHTALEGRSSEDLRNASRTAFEDAVRDWKDDVTRLIEVMAEAADRRFRSRQGFELRRLGAMQTIAFLAEQAVLPMSGLPTEVVSCMLGEITEVAQKFHSTEEVQRGEDGQGKSGYRTLGFPSRTRSIAIREFAPGSQIILDGRVHTINKIVRNWKPVGEGMGFSDPQSLRDVLFCSKCGACWISSANMKGGICAECQHSLHDPACPPIKRRILIPSGFQAEPGSTRSIEDVRRAPYEAAHVGLFPSAVRFSLPDGTTEIAFGRAWVAHLNGGAPPEPDGTNKDRYRVCMDCGLAKVQVGDLDPLATHKDCKDATISTVSLGALQATDALVIRLPQIRHHDRRVNKIAANTWAVAMREQIAKDRGIRIEELGWSTRSGSNGWSLVVYDNAPGGAGFSTSRQVVDHLPDLFRKARIVLENCDCDAVCHKCLLRRDLQFATRDLDRKVALECIEETVLDAMRLPDDKRLLGPETRLVFEGAVGALQSILRQGPGTLRFYCDGDPSTWEPRDWPLDSTLRSWRKGERSTVQIFVSENSWQDHQHHRGLFDNLFGLADQLFVVSQLPQVAGYPVLADFEQAGVVSRLMGYADTPDLQIQSGLAADWGTVLGGCILAGPSTSWTPTGSIFQKEKADLYPPGVIAIHIEVEPWKVGDFGTKILGHHAAQKILAQTPFAAEKPSAIFYSDRFIFSPLQFRMLKELIQAFSPEKIHLQRSKKSVDGTSSRRSSMNWGDDFPGDDMGSRWQTLTDDLLKALFSQIPTEVETRAFDDRRGKIPHDRYLIATWKSGAKIRLSLGQGVSGWKVLQGGRSPHESIPTFDQNWVPRMATEILAANLTIQPTEACNLYMEILK